MKAITEWPQPRTIKEVRSFYGLATFYHRFIKNFNAIMTPITGCLKSEWFQWTSAATKVFTKIKRMMTEAPVMHLPDFLKAFEVTCDTSELKIGGVLSQENNPVAYFSEKLNDARHWYSTYDKKFYTAVQAVLLEALSVTAGVRAVFGLWSTEVPQFPEETECETQQIGGVPSGLHICSQT